MITETDLDDKANEAYPFTEDMSQANKVIHCNQRLAFIAGFKQASEMSEFKDVLRLNETWSLLSVLKKLADASDILLHQKDYDGNGWEQHEYALREANVIIELLETQPPKQR